MNTDLMEQLLNESESNYLDFKSAQYPFDGELDEVKSELLKDILAMANAWRRTDGYILIGVEEVKGGRSKPVGVLKHLDDHSLQQFVNSKTQRPLEFSYTAFPFEGLQIGIIRIPLQEKPIYLVRDYGKLKKFAVYIRRGSSTGEANPDEIAKMGRALTEEQNEPRLELQFVNIKTRTDLGVSLTIESEVVELPDPSQIPPFGRPRSPFEITGIATQPNHSYYKELAEYIDLTSVLVPVGFSLKNIGSKLAANARLVITAGKEPSVLIGLESEYPDRPTKYYSLLSPSVPSLRSLIRTEPMELERHEGGWTLTVNFGSVQPKAVVWSEQVLYVGARRPSQLEWDGQIFADNLSEPILTHLSINFTTRHRKLDLKELLQEQE
jgi:hypothetical protein